MDEPMKTAWRGFRGTHWTDDISVRDFIQDNYAPYDGDESFLAEPTEATDKLWGRLQELQKQERERNGVLECETEIVSGLTAYGPGYIDESMKDLEQIVGLQTDKPLKRAFMPYGGIKMAEQAASTYGYKINPKFHKIFNAYHKTHNQAVFDAYTPEMKRARHAHVVTGLPDTYGRGRIVGDYRRVALYGIDFLIEKKKEDLEYCGCGTMTDDVIRQREELSEQIRALEGMKAMASVYGYDISKPAVNAKEAVQWLYFGYLAAIKTQNGAAMSVGRISTFLDIYIERDLREGTLTESQAQELIDHLVMKFRMVKFARIPSYNQLFSGDPIWATLEMAGMGMDGRSMVTKNDFRFLHTLENMGPSPEPNLTVLYSSRLPEPFKLYASKVSINTSSVQYENDDVMRPVWKDDYSICCCVSATETGKEMQFFGARANLAKALLYAINGGVDVKTREQVGPEIPKITSEYLDYDEVMHKYDLMMDWLAGLYVNILNLIHYMHDKYYYEAAEMALIDTDVRHRNRGVLPRRGLAVRYQIRESEAHPGRRRAGGRFRDDRRFPQVRQRRRPRRRYRRVAFENFHEENPQISHLPQFRADDFYPYDYFQRGLRQGDRSHAGRAQGVHAVRPRRQSLLRRGKERSAGVSQQRGETPLRIRARRHFQHADHQPRRAGPYARRTERDARQYHGRLFRPRRPPSQCQRVRHGEAHRLHGTPGKAGVREFYHPRVRVRRQVYQSDERTAVGRYRPNLS